MRDDKLTFRKTEEIHEAIVEGRLNFEDAVNMVLLIMFLYMDEMRNENHMGEQIDLKILGIARDKCIEILNNSYLEYLYKITREDKENEN